MTQTQLPDQLEGTADRTRVTVIGVAVLALTTAFTIWRADSQSERVVALAVLVLSVVGVYGFLLPRKLPRNSAPTTAMILAALAGLLLLPAFWSGQSLVLGAAGALLGWRGRNAAMGSRRCVAAVVIGILSALGYIVIYLVDWLLPS